MGEGGEIAWTDIDDPTKVCDRIQIANESSLLVKSLISFLTMNMKFL